MVRNKGHVSDESTPYSRRESSYRGRGRGRGRGRYSKNYHRNHTYNNNNDHPEHQRSKHPDNHNRSYLPEETNLPLDYEDTTENGLVDRMNMEDLYDDRPVQEAGLETVNEGRPLQDRISLPGERKNDLYPGNDNSIDETMGNSTMDDAARFDNASYENDYAAEDSGSIRDLPQTIMVRSASTSGKEDSNIGNKDLSISNKDPEELRQKVLESLAEKKKKAAQFMNMEKEGASIHKDQPNDTKVSVNNANPGSNGETGNPERDAAVDALLATFGSNKEENGLSTDMIPSRKNSDTDIATGAPSYISPETSDPQRLRHEQYKYDDTPARPPSRSEKQRESRRASDYSTRLDDHDRYRDSHGESRNPSLASSRHDQRGDVRKSLEYDEKDRKAGARHDLRYRYERYEDSNYPKDHKSRNGLGSSSGRKDSSGVRYHPASENRRDPRYDEYYRGSEAPRTDHSKDAYGTMKPPRYPMEVGLQDVEYSTINRDYPPYPATGRYAPPREDPRYPPTVPRPPEADYAALYYRDVTEWLDITGYHDLPYRQMLLQRHREARAESSRYAQEHDLGYVPRAPREESGPRRPRGSSMYSMPPPLAPSAWDERESAKIDHRAPTRSEYSVHEERGRDGYRGDDLHTTPGKPGNLKRRPRDEDYEEPSHSVKSARHSYENSHRKISSSYGADVGTMPRNIQGDEPSDETEAVRLALSRRIASARGRDTSPGTCAERSRRRSLSPQRPPFDGHKRDFSKGRRSPGPLPKFEKESHGRGRATSKFPPKDDFRKPFRPRRNSLGEPPSPHERKQFGRGRGRGMTRDFPSYDRNDHYDRRQNNPGDLMDIDRISGFPGESMRNSDTRYFMIKSFNQDNVKMAQQDDIWATQQKNSEILEQAFKEARDVILFFSINKSGKFQGYARMEGPPGSAPVPSWAKNLLWESSGPFRIRWISITDISFHRVAHLKNRLNENQPVLIGRDGQEIDPECGAALCKTIDETAAFRKIHGPSED